MRRWLVGIVLLASCGENGPDGLTRADVAGTYTLRRVNGQPLPFDAPSEDVRILSSEIHLTEQAASAFMLRSSMSLQPNALPEERLFEIGWNLTTGDSLVVQVIYPNSLEEHPGQVRGDTVRITSEVGQTLPAGLYAYVREGE